MFGLSTSESPTSKALRIATTVIDTLVDMGTCSNGLCDGLHGILITIVSDRGSQFTNQFWKRLKKALGTRLDFTMAFHPQTDGQSERTIQTLKDMLRAIMLDFGVSWNCYLPLAEFAYNNSYWSQLKWHHLKLYMVEGVGHLLASLSLERVNFWHRKWSKKLRMVFA
ncbi:Integrase [Theobroma cacao]|nr:Integrase [Theobroma cacao]